MNAQNTTLFPILGLAFSVTNSEEQSILEGLKNLDSQVISVIYDRYFKTDWQGNTENKTNEELNEKIEERQKYVFHVIYL